MYCVKCGAELTNGQKKCPLCETKVYHPDFITDGDSLFPHNDAPQTEYNRFGILFVISVLYLIALSVVTVCDLAVYEAITWSGYTVIALLVTYVIGVLPTWFKRPNPVIFVPCDFLAVLIMLGYISYRTSGGWFLKFACPIVFVLCLIITTVVTLNRYLRRGILYVIGGSIIAFGLSFVLLEYLIRITFYENVRFVWSFYPVTVLFLLGMMIIVVAVCKPLRRSLEKVFFLS